MGRISFVCTWPILICHIFSYNPVSRKKDRTSSILMFSNNSVKLVTLKNCFLMTAKALHSIRMCLTVQVVWHIKHCGCGSCFSMKDWISLVWPMRNRDITTCSLLDFLNASLHSPKMGWIWKSLSWMLMSHRCCHFVWRNFLIVGFKSVYGMERTSGLRSKADLAAESVLSFPFTPMWLGIQHKIIFLWLDIESSLLSSLTINGFSRFLFFSDVKTESESENMINLLYLSLEMMLRARSMAHTSAVKMELFVGRAFLWMVLLRTAAHAVLMLSLEPSVNIYWWSGWCKRIVRKFSR